MAIFRLGDLAPDIHPTAWVHPSAQVIGDVHLGAGVSVWPQAVLRGDAGRITIGAGSNVQDGAVVHTQGSTPTAVGADCVIGHLAHLESCTVEDAVLVGSTAAVLPGAVLRSGAMVAAGAVVTPGFEVPGDRRAQGVPARLVATRSPAGPATRLLAATYREAAVRHRDACVRLDDDYGHGVQTALLSPALRLGSTP